MYKQFFAAFNRQKKEGSPFTRQELIAQFTNGRTESLKDLSPHELTELTMRMNRNAPVVETLHATSLQRQTQQLAKSDKLRKAIISIFHKMNRPPAAAIAWAEKQGINGIKKQFNSYTNQELYKLILVAEKALTDYQNAIRLRLKNEL